MLCPFGCTVGFIKGYRCSLWSVIKKIYKNNPKTYRFGYLCMGQKVWIHNDSSNLPGFAFCPTATQNCTVGRFSDCLTSFSDFFLGQWGWVSAKGS